MKRPPTLVLILLAILAVALVATGQWALGQARQFGSVKFLPWGLGGTAWLTGAVLFGVGALLFALSVPTIATPGAVGWTTHRLSGWYRRFDVMAVLLVTLVAAAARLYRIYDTPAGLWLDETDIAKQALEIINGARPAPWDVARLEVPWLYHYYVALFYRILGPGYLAVKLPHLLISILTAPILYGLARQFLDWPIALASALLWTTMRWSVNVSRWGHVNNLTLFWIGLVLLLLWRAQATGKRWWWMLGGLALGLSQYSYQSSRALVGIVALFLLYRAFTPYGYFRRIWPQIVVFWLIFVVVYAPLAWTYLHNPELFIERSWAINIFNPLFTRDPWATLWDNIGKYAGVFHYRGDHNGRHNIPGEPMLDPITGVLLILGLSLMLRYPRRPQHALLWLWIVTYLAAGILSTEAPNTFRIYALTPTIALIAGLALQGFCDAWGAIISRQPLAVSHQRSAVSYQLSVFSHSFLVRCWSVGNFAFTGLSFTVVILLAAWLNLTTYFHVQATHPAVVGMFNVGSTRVGQYIATLPATATVYLDREFWAFSPVEVINPGRPLTRLITPDHVPPPPGQTGPVVYVLGNYGRLLLPYLQHLYPDARVDHGLGPNGEYVFTGVRLDADVLARKGLKGAWWNGLEPTGSPAWTGVVTPDHAPLASPTSGDLRGGLYLPRAGDYSFRVEGTRRARLTIAGHIVLEDLSQPVTVTLPGGLIPVRLEVALSNSGPFRILWRQPGATAWEPIPNQHWYPLDLPAGGLLALYFEGGGLRKPPVRIAQDATFYADNAGGLATAAVRWLGRVRIPDSSTYTFGLSSDDGSRLWIDGQLVVDNWGLHGAGWVEGQINLDAGWHTFRMDYVDNGGSYWFEARWTPPGQPPGPIPADLLSWTREDLAKALILPENPPPVLRVLDASGNLVDTVPIAAARLGDPHWTQPIGDANFQSWPMKLRNQMFDHGIGLYGPGEVDFNLHGSYQRFQGLVGVDTDTYGDSHTQVQILGDGRVLWDSGVIHPWDAPTAFDVDVVGVQVLTLKQIEEGHFEGRDDGVDWVNLWLIEK